jgi:dienelactone hydrolase
MNITGKKPSRICLLLIVGTLIWLVESQVAAGPGEPGPCAVASQTVNINGALETKVYYPTTDSCDAAIAAPYPAVAFAHGFSMFGLSNGAAENAGNGEHLARWGYVVAIPRLPDDAEERITDTLDVLSYLETETGTPGSFLYQKVDTNRLATAGHSFGGATALAAAARDARVKAVVALDPVYHQGGPTGGDPFWDPETEAPNITVPTVILGAPPSNCNSDADYVDIYPWVGVTHKASYLIVGASHCDFTDPGHFLCYLFCGGGQADPVKTQLSQKYMVAWFNYYLYVNTDHYDYLYGIEADADIVAGSIERQADTAPREFTARGSIEAVVLEWELYEHPIVAGYNIYRHLPSGVFTDEPHVQVGRVSSYRDRGLVAGQIYTYTIRSRDAAHNLHESSDTVNAAPVGSTAWVYLPTILRGHTLAPSKVRDVQVSFDGYGEDAGRER